MNVASIETILTFVCKGVWRASWQASILAALVVLIQSLFTRRLSGRGRYLLWSIVLLRLLLPVVPQSRLSVFNLAIKSDAGPAKTVGDFKSEISNSSVVSVSSPISAEPPTGRDFASLNLNSPGVPGDGVGIARVLSDAVLIAWLVGMLALLIRVLRECLRTSRFVRGLAEISDASVNDIVESCGKSLGLSRLPRILSGQAIHTPAVVGLWRPVLLLPTHVLQRCDPAQISMIVMHELAHLKRRDIAANWVATLATIVHWFNPAVWLIAARIRADRELACDELVLSRAGSTGCNVQTYGNTLLALAELLSPAPAQRQLVGILESSGPLERRIRMIARFNPQASRRWVWPAVILVVLGIAFLTDAVNGQGRGRQSGAPPTLVIPSSQPANELAATTPLTNDQIAKQMEHVLPELRLDKVAFSDVVDFMRDTSGMNIVVDWRSLENAGIDRNAQVSLSLRNVSFAQALDHILRSIGGGVFSHIESGAIVISANPQVQVPDRSPPTEMVFYDVEDLIDMSSLAPDVTMKSLCDAIESTLEAQQRLHVYPGNGSLVIRGFEKKLIITTTADGHQEVSHIVAKLREEPSTQPRSN